MESKGAHDFSGHELCTSNLRSPRVEEYDLQYAYSELEMASSSLFVDSQDDCKVEVFETLNVSSSDHSKSFKRSGSTENTNKLNQKRFLPTNVSTPYEMQTLLKARNLPFKFLTSQ